MKKNTHMHMELNWAQLGCFAGPPLEEFTAYEIV